MIDRASVPSDNPKSLLKSTIQSLKPTTDLAVRDEEVPLLHPKPSANHWVSKLLYPSLRAMKSGSRHKQSQISDVVHL